MPASESALIPSSIWTSIRSSLKNDPPRLAAESLARDSAEVNRIVVGLAQNSTGRVIKIKSMTTEETGLNRALEAAGIIPVETDLAELIVQLGHDRPSHIVVPALHKNRHQVRELFARTMNLPDLGDRPEDLAGGRTPAFATAISFHSGCHQRCEFSYRRNWRRLHCGIRRQRQDVPHVAEDPHLRRGHR